LLSCYSAVHQVPIVQHKRTTWAFGIRRIANGATQTAQRRKQSNPDPSPIPHLTLNLTLNDYFRRCAICVAPNTDHRHQFISQVKQ